MYRVAISVMVLGAACGRHGFVEVIGDVAGDADTTPTDTTPTATTGVTSDGDGGFVEATCESSTLLSAYPDTGTAGFGGSYSAATLELRAGVPGPGVGDEVWLMTGEVGVTEYRFDDDAQFGAMVARMTDAVAGTVDVGVTFHPSGPGGYGGRSDAPLVGATVTMIRRDIRMLDFALEELPLRTVLTTDITWEVWGCVPDAGA